MKFHVKNHKIPSVQQKARTINIGSYFVSALAIKRKQRINVYITRN